MKHLFVGCSLLLILLNSQAQKKPFFQRVSIGSYFFIDDINLEKKDWKTTFSPPGHPTSQNFDSLDYYNRFGFGIRGGGGIAAGLQKQLAAFGSFNRKQLQWHTGLGFHVFRMKSSNYSFFPVMTDTTKIYPVESEQFQLRETYADLYNSIRYEVTSKRWKSIFSFIGLGLQVSIPFSSKIKDSYTLSNYQWSTPQRNWIQNKSSSAENLYAAKNPVLFSFSLPLGFGIHFSDQISGLSTIEYFYALRTPSLSQQKKYSEGGVFSLSFFYRF